MVFRIINAITIRNKHGGNLQNDRQIKSRDSNISELLLPFAPEASLDYPGNWFTIILGRNAIGKSQLLSDIAEAFCISSGEFTVRRKNLLNISLDFSINDARKNLNVSSEKNLDTDSISKYYAPTRVVSSATTPFDKFRLSRDIIRDRIPYKEDSTWNSDQMYFYSGLRDNNGRTNFHAFIARSIRGIFLDFDQRHDNVEKLKSVFSFLGLEPMVEIEYSIGDMSWSSKLIEAIFSSTPLKAIEDLEQSYSSARRIFSYLKSSGHAIGIIQSAVRTVQQKSFERKLNTIEVNLDGRAGSENFLESIFLLRDLRLLSIREVNVRRAKIDVKMNILEASSGQISIIAGILGIAAAIRDNSLILIDEPEISLHPEWQNQYLDLLRETFSNFQGCHFVIATHSPLILSDARKKDTTVLNITHLAEGRSAMNSRMGASSDELLVKEFGVVGDENLFLKQEAIKAANSLARGDVSTSDFRERISILSESRRGLSDSSPLKQIINDILSALDRLNSAEQ